MNFSATYLLTGGDDLHLHLDHLRDLRQSGLTDETIRAAGVYSLAPRFSEEFFRKGPPAEIVTALCFPYQGGEFARIKLFPPIGKWKYSQPPGTSARLYAPFPVGAGTVYIPEGEKKTLAAYQAGLNTVGVGGIWNWLTKGRLIDDLNLIDWQNRDAAIIPDSDVWERPDLLQAIYALGRELRDLGAVVSIARIPQDGAVKVGLDDFLIRGGDMEDLDLIGLDQRVFRSAAYWFGRWKLTRAMEAA